MKRLHRALPLLVLIMVCGLPMVAAWAMYLYPGLRPLARSVHGTLIEPGYPLPDLNLSTPAGEEFRIVQMRGRWSVLWLAPDDCGAECAGTAARLHNLRLALREDGARLQILAVPLGDGSATWQARGSAFSGIAVLTGSDQTLRSLAAGCAAAAHLDPSRAAGFYIVDPNGSLMMRYEPNADIQGVLGDLQQLLNYTRERR